MAISAAMIATTSGWAAAAVGIGCGLVGFGICYIGKDYFIGIEGNSTNLTVTNTAGSYNPPPTQPSTVGVS